MLGCAIKGGALQSVGSRLHSQHQKTMELSTVSNTKLRNTQISMMIYTAWYRAAHIVWVQCVKALWLSPFKNMTIKQAHKYVSQVQKVNKVSKNAKRCPLLKTLQLTQEMSIRTAPVQTTRSAVIALGKSMKGIGGASTAITYVYLSAHVEVLDSFKYMCSPIRRY